MGQTPKPIQPNQLLIRSEEYCSFHDCKKHQTIHCWSLRRYLKELIDQDFPQGVRPLPRGTFVKDEHFTFPRAEHDRSV